MSIPLTAIGPISDAIQRQPFGLITDVDGTISPMAQTPSEARVTPRNRALLEALSRRIVVCALSGRDLPDLRRMVDIPTVVLVGLHGLSWLIHGEEELSTEAEPYRSLTRLAAEGLHALRRLPGVVIEVKTVGLAFHYREAGDPSAARTAILEAIAQSPAAANFQVHEGIRIVELRPPLVSNKGLALRRLVERFELRGLLYLGDDVTDVDGFKEARRLRESGTVAAYGIAVTHPEAPLVAAQAADFSVPDVSGVEWLLGEIANAVGARTED